MKRSKVRRAPRGSGVYRVVDELPVVYLGPGALKVLEKGRGVLLGAQRPGWVDVLFFEAYPHIDWRRLVDFRFDRCGDWDAVGISLWRSELAACRQSLVRELIPGDVVLTLPKGAGEPRAHVNRGDRLSRSTLRITRYRWGSGAVYPLAST
ncbi:MAG: hypothetical protein ACE5JI_11300 [Acidobacteriota bacterium]